MDLNPNQGKTYKEKIEEAKEEFKKLATSSIADILQNKKKLIPILVVTIIGLLAFFRGLFLYLFGI